MSDDTREPPRFQKPATKTTPEEASHIIQWWLRTDNLSTVAAEIDKLFAQRQAPSPASGMTVGPTDEEDNEDPFRDGGDENERKDPFRDGYDNDSEDPLRDRVKPEVASGMTVEERKESFRQWLTGYNGCEVTAERCRGIAAQFGKYLTQAVAEAVADNDATWEATVEVLEARRFPDCDCGLPASQARSFFGHHPGCLCSHCEDARAKLPKGSFSEYLK